MLPEEDAGEETNVEVDVVESAEGQERQVETGRPEPQDDDPAAGIESLRRQIAAYEERAKAQQQDLENSRKSADAARVAREEAERRAAKAHNEAVATEREMRESRYEAVVHALSASQGQLAQSKSAYKQAMIDSDFDKAAEIAAEIGTVSARISQLEAGKLEHESQSRRGDGGRVEREREPESIKDQQDSFIQRLPPRSAAWVREHRERYFNDSAFQNMVSGAHQLAVGRGIQQDSDGYFDFIEKECGLRQRDEPHVEHQEGAAAPPPAPTAKSPTSTAAASAPRRSPTPSAPAAGGAPTSARSSGSPSVGVQLTPEEREFCRINDIKEEGYAQQKKQLMDEKRLGPQAVH